MEQNAAHQPTKLRILQAVERLTATTAFEKMTVTTICREAGISPPTFYKRFVDKYDIAQWFFDDFISLNLWEIGRTLTWYQGYKLSINTQLDHRELFTSLMAEHKGYQGLPSYGRRRRKETLIETIVDYKHIELTEELNFQIDCVVQIETRTAIDWVKSEMTKPEPKRYAQYLANAVPRQLFELLNDPVSPLF